MIRSALAPLAERDVRHLFLGQTTSTFGNAFANVALAFAVLQTTGSIANVGLALAAMRVPLLAFTLLGGVVGDRLQRRAVLLTADIARFVSQGAAALLLLTDNARLWELLALFACHGLAQAFFSPTMVGLISEVTPPRHLQQTNALFAFSQSAAGATGMLVGGALVSIAGPGYAFGIDALSFLVSAVALATLQLHAVPARIAGATTLLRDLRAGWDAFRTDDGYGSEPSTSPCSTRSPSPDSLRSGRSWRLVTSAAGTPGASSAHCLRAGWLEGRSPRAASAPAAHCLLRSVW
ncbi:MAG: MFS transporter [Actinobacteria bacterium]|uniref:Unannotated protein n=1 Tax=freshwater metagenome TaxID=449393 RepID=A0A6J6QR22_9ZZZZ|nr:MFS transporter [Actinomycetota bacterium]